jgi:hypothetical protein
MTNRLMSVLTLEEIAADVLNQIDRFKAPVVRPQGLVGTPWPEERYAEEIRIMRECLIAPYWATSYWENTGTTKRVAVVAKDVESYYCLVFNPDEQTYGLAWQDESGVLSAFLFGDAVTTFLAR